MLYLVKQLSTLLPLCCHSLLNIGIVRMDGRLPRRPSNKHHHHGGAVHYYSGMSMTNQPALSTGASLEGVGRGRYSRILFNNAYRSLQKLISKVDDFILIFISFLLLLAPKQWTRTYPMVRIACTFYPFYTTPCTHVCGWLLCMFSNQQPSKADMYFVFGIFRRSIRWSKRRDRIPPCAPLLSHLHSSTSPTSPPATWLIVVMSHKRRPPKAKATSIVALFFDGVCVGKLPQIRLQTWCTDWCFWQTTYLHMLCPHSYG